MKRLIPAIVAVLLMLLFLFINQALLFKDTDKESTLKASKQAVLEDGGAHSDIAVPVDNDQRGAHSYFAPPRIVSVQNSNQMIPTSETIPTSNNLFLRTNKQDLLQPGYLNDTRTVYKPAFGKARH